MRKGCRRARRCSTPEQPRRLEVPRKNLKQEEECHKEQKIKEQLGLYVAGLEDEVAERDDQDEIGGGKRRQVPRHDQVERGEKHQRQINVPHLPHDKEVIVG